MHERNTRAQIGISGTALFVCALIVTGIAGAQEDDEPKRILWWSTDIQQVLKDAGDAASDAGTIATRVQSARDKVLDLQDTIEEAVGDLKSRIQDMHNGRAEFLGNNCDSSSPCAQFRTDVVGLLDAFAMSNNALLRAANVNVESDFERLKSAVEQAPGRALFPLYRVLDGHLPIVGSNFSDAMSDLATNLDFLALVLAPPTDSAKLNGIDTCEILLDDPELSQRVILGTTATGVVLVLIGKTLDGLGETHLEAKAGVHGYPGILVKNNMRKTVGNLFSGVGDGVTNLATAASNKLRYCTMIRNQTMILANQEKIWNALPPGWTRGDEILTSDAP